VAINLGGVEITPQKELSIINLNRRVHQAITSKYIL